MTEKVKLQPLRVISGWKVDWNTFYEVDPGEDFMEYFSGSSLLLLSNHHKGRCINLEWRPESDVNGSYKLSVINAIEVFNEKDKIFELECLWGDNQLNYSLSGRREVVAKIESLMLSLEKYKDPRILKSRGIVDELSESLRLRLLNEGATGELSDVIVNEGENQIQLLLLNSPEVSRSVVQKLSVQGFNQEVRNKAERKLKILNR